MKYTKLPNELMDIFMSSALNDTERRILAFIARKTCGYHKQTDRISYSQFQHKLDLARSTVVNTLSRLQLVGIIRLVRKGNVKREPNEWMIDISDISAKLVSIGRLVRYDKGKLVGITGHTKESITKETKREGKQKEEKRPENHSSYLLAIPYKDLIELSNKYSTSQDQIKQKADELHNYCKAHGKIYKDYKAFLSNALKRDFGLRESPKFPEREGFYDAKTLKYH